MFIKGFASQKRQAAEPAGGAFAAEAKRGRENNQNQMHR